MGALSPTYDIRYCEYFPVKDIIPHWRIEKHEGFVERWNIEKDGYFERLTNSISNEGFNSPVLLSKGGGDISRILSIIGEHCDNYELEDFPYKRIESLIRGECIKDLYFTVNRGCARVWAAKQLNLDFIPAIILDFNESCTEMELITSPRQFLSKFKFPDHLHDISFDLYEINYIITREDEGNF